MWPTSNPVVTNLGPIAKRRRWLWLFAFAAQTVCADNFADSWQAALCDDQPPTVRLAYHGAITEYRGQICYHYAGYNETCLNLDSRWLTPATRLRLLTPGQVPSDLLAGYTLRVRFTAISATVHSYPLALTRC